MRTTKLIVTAMLAAAMCAGQAWGATIQSAGSGYWTNPSTWTPAQAPTSDDNVTITNGCTVTMNDLVTRSVSNLTIQAGGVLTHTANSSTEAYKCILSVVSNLTIEAGGQIHGNAKGYSTDNGPGKPANPSAAGSHGGMGGYYGAGVAGPTYGTITSPTNCGSGGSGNAGGGAVIIGVGGASTIDGTISVTGAGSGDYYGGAGGSVFLTTGSLTGTGTISANGGGPSHSLSGGGGRVAVVLTNAMDFGSVVFHAYAGSVPNNCRGAGGTVYLEHTNHVAGKGKLIVDYGSIQPSDPVWTVTMQNGKDLSSYAFSEIVLANGAVYVLDSNDTLDLTGATIVGTPASPNEGIYLNGGTLQGLPDAFIFTNYFIAIGATGTPFNPATSLTVGTNATLKIDVPFTLNCPVIVEAGGSMSHSGDGSVGWGRGSAEYHRMNLTINGSLNIRTNGAVNVDGLGYSAGVGPGKPAGDAAGTHGGRGAYWGSGLPGQTYGSITSPTNCGSGGGSFPGGGAVQVSVRDGLTVNGTISANGGGGTDTYYGGAGGSVFLKAASLAGTGTIRANGGNTTHSLTGGGGRLAVVLTNSTDFGSVKLQAYCGTSPNAPRGASGTIYTETPAQASGRGTLTIDANNVASQDAIVTTLIGPLVKDAAVGNVIVTNSAKLVVSNAALTVYGDWDNKATVGGEPDGTVEFAGTNAATIKGHNTFYNLTCTDATKTKILSFEEGKTNTVNGNLTLNGLTLNSISGGQWYLKASPTAHSVSNVTVSWSDARPGSAIEAYFSTDGGDNYNWVFAESGFNTNYWTGALNSDWTKPGNWSRNRATQVTDTIVVTNGCPNYPLLQAETRILALAISNAASMSLNGYNLVVDDNVRVAGTLMATGTETLTVRGDLDFAGGAFNAATTTVWMAGPNAQTVVSDGESFRNLSISNSAAAVTFTDAVSATNIVNYSTAVAFNGTVTVSGELRSQGAGVTFGGALLAGSVWNSGGDLFFADPVNIARFDNTGGDLVFADTLTATVFDSRMGGLVFTGAVETAAFTNWAGDATFHDEISADRFFCAPGDMELTFEAGITNTIGDLEWYGRGGYPIVLRSSSEGDAWYLKVTNSHVVRQVDVQDSDADSGQTIYPEASTDGGANPNWVFDATWQTWVGTNSGVFGNAANWTPVVAPDATRRLLIDGYYTNAPVLSGVATAAQVIVGGVTTATLTVNGHLEALGDVTVIPNGTITHSSNTSTETNRLRLTVHSNLTVNGAINVDGKGYSANNGPGKPVGTAAGAHGGLARYYDVGLSGPTYGSITSPTNCGSGGASYAGGGAARLDVTGVTTVNGVISANGAPNGDGEYYAGAGGSVFLTTGSLAGGGIIRANGGSTWGYLTGAGGRIAVILTNAPDFGGVVFQTYAGTNASDSACGTIYLQSAGQSAGHGTLIVDANNKLSLNGTITTLIRPGVTDTTVGSVVITNAARLAITNQTLTVNGDWENKATFTALADGTVDFAGTNTATIYTNNTFYNLAAGAAGKIIKFEAGRTNTVTGLLKLGAAQSGQMVTLQSTVGGSWSYLTLVPGGTQAIARVNVKDNNASGGQTLLAGNGSANGGNNVNWWFPPSGTMFMVR